MNLVNTVFNCSISLKILVLVIIISFTGDLIPQYLQALFYAISLTLKSFLLFVLPFIVFSSIFSCVINFQSQKKVGIYFILFLFLAICISNALATYTAYGIQFLNIIQADGILINSLPANCGIQELVPLYEFNFPNLISNDLALISGILTGFFSSFFPHPCLHKFSLLIQKYTSSLGKYFNLLLPLFITGFLLKLQHDHILVQTIKSYFPLFIMIICSCFIYCFLLLFTVSNFKFYVFLRYLKAILPVILLGFSTTSSLASISATLSAAEKNTNNQDISRTVILSTVNIHTMGDCLISPLIALIIVNSFYLNHIGFVEYNYFLPYFLLVQFAMAGVPGGGILVMLPIFEAHFGFSREMSIIFSALYILMDPLITVINLIGNSTLVIIVVKIFKNGLVAKFSKV